MINHANLRDSHGFFCLIFYFYFYFFPFGHMSNTQLLDICKHNQRTVGRNLQISSSSTPLLKQLPHSRSHRKVFRIVLNISREGHSATSINQSASVILCGNNLTFTGKMWGKTEYRMQDKIDTHLTKPTTQISRKASGWACPHIHSEILHYDESLLSSLRKVM